MNSLLSDGRIKLRHLQCFLAVAQLGNLQKAATSLAITQPAVSKTLAELEDILGTQLFERGRSGATPTRQAQRFLPHASACLSALRDGVSAVSRGAEREVIFASVGILPTLTAALMPALLERLRRQWPDMSLRILTGTNKELIARLKEGAIDVAISRASDPELMAGLSFEYLYSEPLVAVVRSGHSLCAPLPVDAAQLTAYPVLLPPVGTIIRQSADRLLAAIGAPQPAICVELLSVSGGRALVLESDAVWFVPRSAVAHDLTAGLLACLPLATAGAEEPVGLALRIDAPRSPVMQALLDAIRGAAQAAAQSQSV